MISLSFTVLGSMSVVNPGTDSMSSQDAMRISPRSLLSVIMRLPSSRNPRCAQGQLVHLTEVIQQTQVIQLLWVLLEPTINCVQKINGCRPIKYGIDDFVDAIVFKHRELEFRRSRLVLCHVVLSPWSCHPFGFS